MLADRLGDALKGGKKSVTPSLRRRLFVGKVGGPVENQRRAGCKWRRTASIESDSERLAVRKMTVDRPDALDEHVDFDPALPSGSYLQDRSLAQKEALNARVRNGRADFERGPARKASDSFGIAETKSLIEFRIDPKLCVFPQFDAYKIHEIKALTALLG
jgi:hypothetical protein